MTLLEKCQIWNGDREYQKIIDAIEALPEDERTPELDSELARAYNNRAEAGDRELFKKAIELLEPHAEYFSGGTRPARSAVQVATLPRGGRVEIEAVAVK